MVIFLTLQQGAGHIMGFIRRWDNSYARRINEITYDSLCLRQTVPRAAYVFGDRERMSMGQRRIVTAIWDQLATAGVPLYNHPLRQLGRYELLRVLHDDGVNDFNVFRVDELDAALRWPVFVRVEDDHSGPRSELLYSRSELEIAVDRLILSGVEPERVLVVEHCETADEHGVYRKYGALRTGNRIVGMHAMMSMNWNNKWQSQLRTPEVVVENDGYYRTNPHQELLMPIFERAKVEYGRIDYGMRDGRIQVWEINDNPRFVSGARRDDRITRENKGPVYMSAFESMGEGLVDGSPIPIDVDAISLRTILRESSR